MSVSFSAVSLALLSALLTAAMGVAYRIWMKRQADAWAIVLFNSFFAGTLLLLVIPTPQITQLTLSDWGVLVLSNSLWAAMVYYDLKAYEALDIGLNALLDTLRFVFLFLVGAWFFHEPLGLERMLGMLLIIAALLFGIRLNQIRYNSSFPYRLISVVCGSLAMACDKYLTTYLDINVVLVAGYFIPGIIYLMLRPSSLAKIIPEIIESRGSIVLIAVVYAAIGLCIIYALGTGALSTFSAISQTKLVFSLILGALILGEWTHMRSRFISAAFCLLGVFLILKT